MNKIWFGLAFSVMVAGPAPAQNYDKNFVECTKELGLQADAGPLRSAKRRHFRGLAAKSLVSGGKFWESRTEGPESRGESPLDDFSISEIWSGSVQRPVAYARRPVRISGAAPAAQRFPGTGRPLLKNPTKISGDGLRGEARSAQSM